MTRIPSQLIDTLGLSLPNQPDMTLQTPAGKLYRYAYEMTDLYVASRHNTRLHRDNGIKALCYGVNLALGYDLEPQDDRQTVQTPHGRDVIEHRLGVAYVRTDLRQALYETFAQTDSKRLACILGTSGVLLYSASADTRQVITRPPVSRRQLTSVLNRSHVK